jgi:hypothetical protein
MFAPDSYGDWLKTMCGFKLNPAVGLGIPGQPSWLVLNERDEAIGCAEDLKAGNLLIERYIQQELKQRARAATEAFIEELE